VFLFVRDVSAAMEVSAAGSMGVDPFRSRVLTQVAFAVLGLSGWVTINGLFARLADLSQLAGWGVSSQLTIVIQVANIAPVIFLALRARGMASVSGGMIASLIMGVASMLALSWSWTVMIGKLPAALLGFSFVAACADAMSTITYYTFVAEFVAIHAVSLTVGEAFGTLVAGALSYAPCSTSWYFVMLAIILLFSAAALVCLLKSPMCLAQRVSRDHQLVDLPNESGEISDGGEMQAMMCLGAIGLVCAYGNGVVPAVITASVQPYGDSALHLANVVPMVCEPLAACVSLWKPASYYGILFCALLTVVSGTYVVALVWCESSSGICERTSWNAGLAVVACTLQRTCNSYTRASAVAWLRADVTSKRRDKHMSWVGVLMQVGSLTGAITGALIQAWS